MIAAIIQARTSSTRLPGKVVASILGRPMLDLEIERIRRARRLDHIAVATSRETDDDEIDTLCQEIGIDCHRGSLENVLERYLDAAKAIGATRIVRLTADCPLADPDVIDALVTFFEHGRFDYASNTLEPTWPHGLDAEIMSIGALETANRKATSAADLEHVTHYLYNNPNQFALGSFQQDLDQSQYRWTVDYPEDLELVTAVFEHLYPDNAEFTTNDIVAFLASHPDVASLNRHIETRTNKAAAVALR
jgi:spore coat polysaccharide biosynthesis protein SpsF